MTEEQKAIETAARMEKNREIARHCRKRKKAKIRQLEEKVAQYEQQMEQCVLRWDI